MTFVTLTVKDGYPCIRLDLRHLACCLGLNISEEELSFIRERRNSIQLDKYKFNLTEIDSDYDLAGAFAYYTYVIKEGETGYKEWIHDVGYQTIVKALEGKDD